MSLVKSKLLNIASWQAIGFGIFLLIAETFRNWGAWPYWTSYAFDYLFAALLLTLGLVARRGSIWPIGTMVPIWVLVIALFTWSFMGHVSSLDQPTYGVIPHLRLTIGIGVLDLVAMISLVTCMRALIKTRTSNGVE